MKQPDEPQRGRPSPEARTPSEFTAAMARLEKAVSEIVKVTTDQLSERATTLLDDTSARLEAELRINRASEDHPEVEQMREHRSRRRRSRHRLVDRAERVNPRSGRLYRDPENQKVGGVCAGIARYFGMEPWTVRLGALTGLIFLPGIVFPAYWIAFFIMDTPPNDGSRTQPNEKSKGSLRSAKRRARRDDNSGLTAKPAEELSPSRSLRYTSADLTEVELRLRRIESFVTSDQYELHKELAKIEADGEAEAVAKPDAR